MAFDPLQERGIPLEKQWRNWSELNSKPYDSHNVEPHTRVRLLILDAMESESFRFSHQFSRHSTNPEIRRALALTRRIELQQKNVIHNLIPAEESNLALAIGQEQMAVALTAFLAQTESNVEIRQALEFGLLEELDHLYRFSNLWDLIDGKKATELTGPFTEITVGRPTSEQHRHPYDTLPNPSLTASDNAVAQLHLLTLAATEMQTMDYYLTISNRPIEPLARGLYLEIAQIEEQHITQYESFLDPNLSLLQQEVLHHYNECYLYYSFLLQEPDLRLRQLFELHLNMEIGHLEAATGWSQSGLEISFQCLPDSRQYAVCKWSGFCPREWFLAVQ